jgi:hypothetical protein
LREISDYAKRAFFPIIGGAMDRDRRKANAIASNPADETGRLPVRHLGDPVTA